MANKTVFALATVMLVLSFLVSHFERFFFTLNFLESLIYLAILLLLFYGLEEWAYAVGIAAPVFWMALAWAGGLLGGSLGEFARTVSGGGVQSPHSVSGYFCSRRGSAVVPGLRPRFPARCVGDAGCAARPPGRRAGGGVVLRAADLHLSQYGASHRRHTGELKGT